MAKALDERLARLERQQAFRERHVLPPGVQPDPEREASLERLARRERDRD